jgi:phage baseplate assembly protein gpV
MSAAPGIAGSDRPEQEGCFVCLDQWETDWFVEMNNTGGPVDVWAVDGVDESELVTSPEGHSYVPTPIPAQRVSLHRRDIQPVSQQEHLDRHSAPIDGPTVLMSFEPRPPKPSD